MAGIYIHIPFCKQKCSYCDFHFSTDSSYANRMVQAICTESVLRKEFLKGEVIETIYFGGGTPSHIRPALLTDILKAIRENHTVAESCEITIEANPDDLSAERLENLFKTGVNRLSIGIQSFEDAVLKDMNRSHDASQAKDCISRAQDIGFKNISVDIIYGLPNRSMKSFEEDLKSFLDLNVQHISAYQLTIEKHTHYAKRVEQGKMIMPDDEEVASQFFFLKDKLDQAGYRQYEVSNFSKDGFVSRHNSSYWSGKSYVGIGPSAHSYDSVNRYWNIANNQVYMRAIESGSNFYETEVLDENTRYNEYVLTRSRTKWGLDLNHVEQEFGIDIISEFESILQKYKGSYSILDGHLILNEKGIMLADGFASDLFRVE